MFVNSLTATTSCLRRRDFVGLRVFFRRGLCFRLGSLHSHNLCAFLYGGFGGGLRRPAYSGAGLREYLRQYAFLIVDFKCDLSVHVYDNEKTVREMVARQKDMKIPTELIPKCPVCGAPITMNLRSDMTFVQDEGWYAASNRYDDFIRRHEGLHILFFELGVGANTPVIIKYPFWQMTAKNPKAVYVCVNFGEAFCPREIEKQSICLNMDIGKAIKEIT